MTSLIYSFWEVFFLKEFPVMLLRHLSEGLHNVFLAYMTGNQESVSKTLATPYCAHRYNLMITTQLTLIIQWKYYWLKGHLSTLLKTSFSLWTRLNLLQTLRGRVGLAMFLANWHFVNSGHRKCKEMTFIFAVLSGLSAVN